MHDIFTAREGKRRSARRDFDVADRVIVIQDYDWFSRHFSRGYREQLADFRRWLTNDGGDTGLEDSRFFSRDRLQSVTEQISMIEANRRDSCHSRGEHVRRVQAATKPGLDDSDVHFLLDEPVERESGRHLEKRCAHFFGGRYPVPEKLEHFLLENRLAVESEALTEINQVRRGVSPDYESSRSQQRFTGGNDASLAVGTGDMDR